MEALNSEQSTLRVRGNVRYAQKDHSVEEFFQPRATGKLPSSSTFAPLIASKGAASNSAPLEDQLEDQWNKEFEGDQMQLNDAVAEIFRWMSAVQQALCARSDAVPEYNPLTNSDPQFQEW